MSILKSPLQTEPPKKGVKETRKQDALALAQLLYDIYKDNQDSDKIINGQNNANQTKDD